MSSGNGREGEKRSPGNRVGGSRGVMGSVYQLPMVREAVAVPVAPVELSLTVTVTE